uniref:Uncharacterized protein n=1 Tax=Toxoplasma gondii COUG TaxID=1074873 RepID=A0A2G8XN47_TOXGO|nr:hypothetical protein TGCOUG_395720 [Toxoplasma gondii COUG]
MVTCSHRSMFVQKAATCELLPSLQVSCSETENKKHLRDCPKSLNSQAPHWINSLGCMASNVGKHHLCAISVIRDGFLGQPSRSFFRRCSLRTWLCVHSEDSLGTNSVDENPKASFVPMPPSAELVSWKYVRCVLCISVQRIPLSPAFSCGYSVVRTLPKYLCCFALIRESSTARKCLSLHL